MSEPTGREWQLANATWPRETSDPIEVYHRDAVFDTAHLLADYRAELAGAEVASLRNRIAELEAERDKLLTHERCHIEGVGKNTRELVALNEVEIERLKAVCQEWMRKADDHRRQRDLLQQALSGAEEELAALIMKGSSK